MLTCWSRTEDFALIAEFLHVDFSLPTREWFLQALFVLYWWLELESLACLVMASHYKNEGSRYCWRPGSCLNGPLQWPRVLSCLFFPRFLLVLILHCTYLYTLTCEISISLCGHQSLLQSTWSDRKLVNHPWWCWMQIRNNSDWFKCMCLRQCVCACVCQRETER